MPVVINGTTGVSTPGIAVDGTTAGVNGGFFSVTDNDGTITGSYTPVLSPSNWKSIINGGAFTFTAPAAVNSTSAYNMIVYIANSATSGAITFSGFTRVIGDTFTTTNGHVFLVYITVFGTGMKIANVVAGQ